METTSVLFYNKCRLCLEEAGVTVATDDLANDIFTLTGVVVKESDNLPQKVCIKCLEIIEKAKNLKKVARNNDEMLRCLFDIKEEEILMDSEDKKHSKDESLNSERKCEEENKSSSQNDSKDKKHNKHKSLKSQRKWEQKHKRSNQNVDSKDKKCRKDKSSTSEIKSEEENKSSDRNTCSLVQVKKEEKPYRYNREQYVCEICKKYYDTSKKLYLHNRLHNKKFLCPLDACGKKFATKGDLTKHLRIHTGVKPYSCEICDKRFSQQGSLKVHKETVHLRFTFQ